MATVYTANAKLGLPSPGDVGFTPVFQATLNKIDGTTAVGGLCVTFAEIPSASLNVAVSGGNFANSSGILKTYAGTASQAIPASSTRNLYLTDAGALTVAASWPTGTPHVPLATVIAGTTTITSITDQRVVCRSVTR